MTPDPTSKSELTKLAEKIISDICDWSSPRNLAGSIEDTAMRIARFIQSDYIPRTELKGLLELEVEEDITSTNVQQQQRVRIRNELKQELKKELGI